MTGKELTQKYLEFFESKGHAVIPSASLIPENDPSVLFNTAGMQPLVPYLLGEPHPKGTRLTNVQKCLRTGDLDIIGDDTHHTFFQMLGNWSLGDYFKKEAIEWSFEFLTSPEWLGIPLEKLAFTVYEGDEQVSKDQEAAEIWESLGVPTERIAYFGKDNFWKAGDTGPCGPSTEMFYWSGKGDAPAIFDPHDDTWVEIWNDVFMTYNKTAEKLEELSQKNVDTGMGLERTAAVLAGKASAYETDLFQPLIQVVEELSEKEYSATDEIKTSMRIIADHIRSSVFVLGDPNGVVPSNKDQGYVLRRLIRRAVNHGRKLGITENFLDKVAGKTIQLYKDIYAELDQNKEKVLGEIAKEEDKFRKTLEQGLKKFEEVVDGYSQGGTLMSGKDAFDLYQSYGFPIDMTVELAKERGIDVDVSGFEHQVRSHQDLSRAGSEQKFKGGLADHSDMSVKYHTATHLLHAALQKVLGPEALQRGSNINPKRLRFDFAWPEKMTDEQKKATEDLVNAAIDADYPVTWQEMPLEQAKDLGAIGLFDDNYDDVVKVYTVGDPNEIAEADPTKPTFSRELCGGPHVENTGVLGHFIIKKEESCSAGVRRIKAILE